MMAFHNPTVVDAGQVIVRRRTRGRWFYSGEDEITLHAIGAQ